MTPSKHQTAPTIALATLSVLALLLISDMAPRQADDFADLPADGKPFEILCTITTQRDARGGKLLELRDQEGELMRAYCPNGTWVDIQLPCVAYITGHLDNGAEPFMFIDAIEPCDKASLI
ncbi:MAG: hypothetical protein HPY73_05155 [Methanomassiliicoccales archaeon]|nr:MAG: hypothetical protein HPY73_05155 [Methanomassiliicoccales archaeon]